MSDRHNMMIDEEPYKISPSTRTSERGEQGVKEWKNGLCHGKRLQQLAMLANWKRTSWQRDFHDYVSCAQEATNWRNRTPNDKWCVLTSCKHENPITYFIVALTDFSNGRVQEFPHFISLSRCTNVSTLHICDFPNGKGGSDFGSAFSSSGFRLFSLFDVSVAIFSFYASLIFFSRVNR